MPFVNLSNLSVHQSKLKDCNNAILHKLCGNGTTNQFWVFVATKEDVLLDLNHANFVVSSLGLHRK